MENEYAYTLHYLDEGKVWWSCDVCDTESDIVDYSPTVQKKARIHVMKTHMSHTEVCKECGHKEVVWS